MKKLIIATMIAALTHAPQNANVYTMPGVYHSKTQTVTDIVAIKSRDFSEVNKIKKLAEKDARKVFDTVASGSVPLIWYDLPPVRCQSGAVSFLRYALHKSTKKQGYLQLSCMEIKSGCMIPTSDRQYNITDSGFSEFFWDLPQVANINYLEQ